MQDDLDDLELDSLDKFRVFIRLFHCPKNTSTPITYWCGGYTSNKNTSFEQIEEYVKNNLPEDKKQLLDILYFDMFLPDQNFVPEPKRKQSHPATSKLIKLDGGMSYVCVLRRF
jgi:hypothetical protein